MKARSKFQMQQFEHRTLNVQHRTSNKDIARAAQALAPRVAPLDYKIETLKVYSHSMFDVGRSFISVHSSVYNRIRCI